MFIRRVNRLGVLIAATVALCIVALSLGLYFGLQSESSDTQSGSSKSALSLSPLGNYSSAAVTTNGYPCAKIGSDILLKNGSAVDAAIAALFCEGIACLQSMGIGGGFLMTIYSSATQKAETLNARETAPDAAYEDMYHGNSNISQFGGKAAAVPGELLGYWEAFKKYGSGNVEWRELIEPSIKLCEEGIIIPPYLGKVLQNNEQNILISESIREILVGSDGHVLKAGDRLKRPKLAETLRQIANSNGVEIFYNGTLGDLFIDDVQALGGIITKEDLKNYKVKWEEPVVAKLRNDITMYTTPLPGSGVLLAFMLNILNNFVPTADDVTIYQRITETFKFGYGKRTELGDLDNEFMTQLMKNLTDVNYATQTRYEIEDDKTSSDPAHYGSVLYQPEDHGTAHISVLAPNGDAVSVTSTINLIFGAMVRSVQTGIILNNEMDDFSAPNITNAFGIPPSPNNFIEPGKRPLSSMCPSIFVDAYGKVRLVAGAAGGTKITTATALTSIFNLWFNMTINEAVDTRRIHHQLYPMWVQVEEGVPKNIVEGLQKIGHETQEFATGGATVTAIAQQEGRIYATSDFRRAGVVAGF